jgi:hypothetical protein
MKRKKKVPAPDLPKKLEKTTPKGTVAQVEQRVLEVHSLLLQGRPRWWIQKHGAEQWGLSPSTMDKYVCRANELLEENLKQTASNSVAQIIEGHWEIYRKAMALGDLKSASASLVALSKLKGIDKPQEVSLYLKKEQDAKLDEQLDALSDEELDRALVTVIADAVGDAESDSD